MARYVHSLIFLSAILLLPACFRSKTTWYAAGDRSQTTLSLDQTTSKLGHGNSATFVVSGGSGQYACDFVPNPDYNGVIIGTLMMKTDGAPRCVYFAPSSGKKLELGIKITDARFPDRQVVASVYVPASGTPDSTFTDNALGSVTGKVWASSNLDTTVTDVLVDAAGNYLVGSYATDISPSSARVSVRRLKPDGTLDASFGTGGVYQFGMATNPCGTGAGVAPILKKIALEHTGSGIRVAFEQGPDEKVIRLRSDGTVDTNFGGFLPNYGLNNQGTPPGISAYGCSDIRAFGNDGNSLSMDLSTMFLDHDDNMYFSSVYSTYINIRKVYPSGNLFRQVWFSPVNQTPAYALPHYNRGVFFEDGNKMFLAFPVQGSLNLASLFLYNFKESGITLVRDNYFGSVAPGVLLNTDVAMAGADRYTTPWSLRQVEVQSDGRIFFSGSVSYQDILDAHNDLNTFVYGNLSSLSDAVNLGITNPDSYKVIPAGLTAVFSQNAMNIPQRSNFGGGLYGDPSLDDRGFGRAIRSSDGSYFILGTSEQDANLVMPIMARMLPHFGGLDTAFGLAQQGAGGDAFDQRWQLELTDTGGQKGAFKTGAVLSDGKYLAGGYLQFSTFNGGRKAGWLSRYWP